MITANGDYALAVSEFRQMPPPRISGVAVSTYSDGVVIRAPRPDDIRGIVAIVRTCAPYLTVHSDYVYFRDIRCCGRTCAVAELGGEVVGWCSMMPQSDSRYFLHQLGVAPGMRRKGVAEALLIFQLDRLERHLGTDFDVELTIDRGNAPALSFFRNVAEELGLELLKSGDRVRLLEEECSEELYTMTHPPDFFGSHWMNDATGYSFGK